MRGPSSTTKGQRIAAESTVKREARLIQLHITQITQCRLSCESPDGTKAKCVHDRCETYIVSSAYSPTDIFGNQFSHAEEPCNFCNSPLKVYGILQKQKPCTSCMAETLVASCQVACNRPLDFARPEKALSSKFLAKCRSISALVAVSTY